MNGDKTRDTALPGAFYASLSEAGHVDQICDEFEKSWQSGSQPRLEDYLARAPRGMEEGLFAELLQTELELRQKTGESVRLEDLNRRFPGRGEAVASVYRRVVRLRRLGDYELLEKRGRGGMGEVYLARHTLLNQTVAVKVLPDRYLDDPQLVARFRREMQLIGQLDHPNIVRAYYAGESQGVYYLAMEYVDGETLQQAVERQGPLSIGAACEAIRQAAEGLQCAWEHGIVHRDLKPSNLMLARTGAVKVLDMGLACCRSTQFSENLTHTGLIMGTEDYMAPEQWENSSQVSIQADIYSLGCTLFFLLSGQPPFSSSSGNRREKLMAHAVAPVPSLKGLRGDFPEDLEKILGHMMAKAAEDRFDSPAELADAVGLFAQAEELRKVVASPAAEPRPRTGPRTPAATFDTARNSQESSRREKSTGLRRLRPWQRGLAYLTTAVALVLIVALTVVHFRLAGLRRELVLVPGLNGQWWFDDMPWYLPAVRRTVADTYRGTKGVSHLLGRGQTLHYDPNVLKAQQWLWEESSASLGGLPPSQRKLAAALAELSALPLTGNELAARVRECLAQFTADKDEEGDWSAADYHTRALLEHQIAFNVKDQEMATAAAASYDLALAAYAPDDPLRRLCLSDSARLYSLVLKDEKDAYQTSQARFQEAIEGETPLPFFVENLAALGVAGDVAGKSQDPTPHDRAIHRVTDTSLANQSHPLVAHLHERKAWSLIDQWRIDEAENEFGVAFQYRNVNFSNVGNPFAQVYVFHNRHGLAMVKRYRGDIEGARETYRALVEDVKKALQHAESESRKSQPGQQRFVRDLRERLFNGQERLADCVLYQTAVTRADRGGLARAAETYREAYQLAAKNDESAALVIGCKWCLALALLGDEVSLATCRGQMRSFQGDAIKRDAERFHAVRRLLQAVLALREKGVDAGRLALRNYLDRQLNENDDSQFAARWRREPKELQLLAAELLVSTDLEAKDTDSATKDARYYEQIFNYFRSRQCVLPFLWRHYDLAIRAIGTRDARRAATLILASRTEKPADAESPNPQLLLHLGLAGGLAVLASGDSETAAFELPFGRRDVTGSAQPVPLRLPEPLVKKLAECGKAGQTIDVYWCDAKCWRSDADPLQKTDWPFTAQLDPGKSGVRFVGE